MVSAAVFDSSAPGWIVRTSFAPTSADPSLTTVPPLMTVDSTDHVAPAATVTVPGPSNDPLSESSEPGTVSGLDPVSVPSISSEEIDNGVFTASVAWVASVPGPLTLVPAFRLSVPNPLSSLPDAKTTDPLFATARHCSEKSFSPKVSVPVLAAATVSVPELLSSGNPVHAPLFPAIELLPSSVSPASLSTVVPG